MKRPNESKLRTLQFLASDCIKNCRLIILSVLFHLNLKTTSVQGHIFFQDLQE